MSTQTIAQQLEHVSAKAEPPKHAVSQTYAGGANAPGGWVDYVPAAWLPYIQLSRLNPPAAGVFLIYIPHLFGLFHGAVHQQQPPDAWELARIAGILLGHSLFWNNAGHAWNDLIDAPIDRQIERTKNRPVARGAISPLAAVVFTATQMVGAGLFLLPLPRATAYAVVPTVLSTGYYPFAKRHTHMAQVVLGFWLSWAIVIGAAAVGVEAPWRDPSILALVVASTLWVVVYDSIYARLDLASDRKIGVKSMAVLIAGNPRAWMSAMVLVMGAALVAAGRLGGMGQAYYTVSVAGSLASVGWMVAAVDLDNAASCWAWFSKGYWLTSATLLGGLVAEYLA